MRQALLFLALATVVVGCSSRPAAVAHSAGAPTAEASATPRFSWQPEAGAPVADATRLAVLAVRADLSLIELSAIERRDPGTRLQLIKSGKNVVVEVIRADDISAVVAVIPGQPSAVELNVGDDVGFAVLAP